jgi:hypothetical protein
MKVRVFKKDSKPVDSNYLKSIPLKFDYSVKILMFKYLLKHGNNVCSYRSNHFTLGYTNEA